MEDDLSAWLSEYLIKGSGGWMEFGRPSSFMKADPTPVSHLESPALTSLWRKDETVLAELSFDPSLHTSYGAPSRAWVNYTATTTGLAVTLTLVNKTSTRLPEALYFGFNPIGDNSTWAMDKLGGWTSPLDVVDGAAKGMHCVSSGVRWTSSPKTSGTAAPHHVFFGSLDAPVVRWDALLPFPTPLHRQPDLSLGLAFNLHNNVGLAPPPVSWCFHGRSQCPL